MRSWLERLRHKKSNGPVIELPREPEDETMKMFYHAAVIMVDLVRSVESGEIKREEAIGIAFTVLGAIFEVLMEEVMSGWVRRNG